MLDSTQVQRFGRQPNSFVTMVELFQTVSQWQPAANLTYREFAEALMGMPGMNDCRFEITHHPNQPDVIMVRCEQLPDHINGNGIPNGLGNSAIGVGPVVYRSVS